jgi:hypothetical protein
MFEQMFGDGSGCPETGISYIAKFPHINFDCCITKKQGHIL